MTTKDDRRHLSKDGKLEILFFVHFAINELFISTAGESVRYPPKLVAGAF